MDEMRIFVKLNVNLYEVMANQRTNFGSKMGMVLAAAGSAVGLGNVWRFPTETGENGGGAFILIYIAALLIFGLPVMLSEFVIGRSARLSAGFAFSQHHSHGFWRWFGRFQVLIPFLILCYYNVVAGWTLYYLYESVSGALLHLPAAQFSPFFADFTQNAWLQILFFGIFMLLTHLIVVQGVSKGIERSSKLMMPALFVILVVLVVLSMTTSGASAALDFLFTVDFSKVTGATLLSAMGQAFYTLSLGMGILTTYASYFKDDADLGKSSLNVAVVDTFVAIMAGLMIFPAVFSAGVQPDEGPSLIFIALPGVFQSAFGGIAWLGYLFAVAFYGLLVLATLTSSISIHEVVTAYVHEATGWSRRSAATLISVSAFLLGLLCALSFGPLREVTIGGMTFFDLFDYVTAKWMLPVSGMLIAVLAGWKLPRTVWVEQMTNRGTRSFPFLGIVLLMIRWVCPLGILLIFLNELGLFRFL